MSDPIADMQKLMEGYRFLEVGERIAPTDEIFSTPNMAYSFLDQEKVPDSWIQVAQSSDLSRAGNLVSDTGCPRVRRSLAIEAAWPKRPCDKCRFFVPLWKYYWDGECRRYAPPHAMVGRQHWCGDWRSIEPTATADAALEGMA